MPDHNSTERGEGNAKRALVPTYSARQEQAKPILGDPPGTTPLRYASVEAKDQELELILVLFLLLQR